MITGGKRKSVPRSPAVLAALAVVAMAPEAWAAERFRLITIDPCHFHAALVQKEMYPQVSSRVAVFAPLGPEVAEHIKRVALFNSRGENPTSWELDVHTGPDFLRRALAGPRGGVVVLSGRNARKMERIAAAVESGFHVLADKPWALTPADMPRLQATLDKAERKGLIAYDIMTERYDPTYMAARELLRDPAVFGSALPGTDDDPGVFMESVHHLMKTVAGVPNLRPLAYFDIHEQGEGLTDVGTHLVDLTQWALFPDQVIDWRTDIEMLGARRWPTVMTRDEFARVTGHGEFPAALARWVKQDRLEYYCNNEVSYRLRGVRVKVRALWGYEAAPGRGDTYKAAFRGENARVEIRQGESENFRRELYVVPAPGPRRAAVAAAVRARVAEMAKGFPGMAVEEAGEDLRIAIPDVHRRGHEGHFAMVARQFFEYVRRPKTIPAWEKPNMLAKYWVTTRGVEMGRQAEEATKQVSRRGDR
jgi:predicted dehydrogenase